MTAKAEKETMETETRRMAMLINEMRNGGGESGVQDDGKASVNESQHRLPATSEDILKALEEKDVS